MSQKSRLETIDRKQSQVSGSALHPIIIGDSGTSTIKVSLKDYPTTTGGGIEWPLYKRKFISTAIYGGNSEILKIDYVVLEKHKNPTQFVKYLKTDKSFF